MIFVQYVHAVSQYTDASTVTIEAMCSPNSAGLKWTARSGYTISVDFSCTSDNASIHTVRFDCNN